MRRAWRSARRDGAPPPAVAPKLAIIVSNYNYEAFVGRAIASVLSQARDDCELVVVDDGSTDGSWEVISGAGVTAYRTANAGQLQACLFGLDRTCAPFILFLDADDELKPGALEVIMAHLEPEVAKLQFGLGCINAAGERIADASRSAEAFRKRDELVEQVLRSGVYKTPPTSGNVFRRDLCEVLREVDYDRAVDGVILFAAPFFGDVVSLAEELGLYRIHGRNDSGLGRGPELAILERDLSRCIARTRHLGAIVERMAPGQRLHAAEATFYFSERRFYADILAGRRRDAARVMRLVALIARERLPVRNKLLLAAFVAGLAVAPNALARRLIALRLEPARRSRVGLGRAVLRRGRGA